MLSHPGKQHSYRQALSLQENNLLGKFITSFYFKPAIFPFSLVGFLPARLRTKLNYTLSKRYLDKLEFNNVEQFPYFEIIREIFERVLKGYKSNLGIYLINQIHDWYVSKRIAELKPDIVIGSETACLRTFKKAKQLGIITILDVPSVHYNFMEMLRDKYEDYKSTFDDLKTINRENSLKDEELEYSDYIFCLSHFAEDTFMKSGISVDKIHILRLGYDKDNFTLKSRRKISDNFKILYVGNISKRKGVNILIEAFNSLALKNSELILIGGLTDAKYLLTTIKGKFKHIPHLNHNELVTYYQDTDIFVFPSYMDSWGLVVPEAMACGTPVIVSENSGSKELVEDGINGFIIPVNDVEELKHKISFFYNCREKISIFGTAARLKVEDYSWDSYKKNLSETLCDIYELSNMKN